MHPIPSLAFGRGFFVLKGVGSGGINESFGGYSLGCFFGDGILFVTIFRTDEKKTRRMEW
jgi:hypothetical protein